MLNFPLSRSDFFDGLRIASSTIDLSENRQFSETGGGEILVSDLGPRLWEGSITISTNTWQEQRKAQALVQALRQGAASFLVGDSTGRYPAADPDGSILQGSSPVLGAATAGSGNISLGGLPPGYVLTPGDYVSWTYGTAPVRYALHQVVIGGTADAGGLLDITVTPGVRPGFTSGTPVSLIDASCKAVMVPGSFRASTQGLVTSSGFQFEWRQSLR